MEYLILILNPLLTGLSSGLVLFFLIKNHIKAPTKRRSRSKKGEAMNGASVAVNSVVEHQKIRTAEIELPVIAEDVLEYEPGELGPGFPDRTRLYYPADAISDPEYLETVGRSPFQIRTHGKNTGEEDRGVDGWPSKVWWDESSRKVMAKGVLHGAANVEYVESNKHMPQFGTSAYISFLEVQKESGTAPNGKRYDAVVRKAVNNHIAILPGIRDPKNVIVAMNAVEEKTVDTSNPSWVADEATWERAKKAAADGNYDDYYAVVTDIYKKMGGDTHGSNAMPIDKDEFKAAMNEYESDKDREEETVNRIVNTVMEKLGTQNKAKNEDVVKADESEQAKNEEGEEKKEEKGEDSAASNALPSEEMVKDFSTHLGITFHKTPSLSELASYVGVTANQPAALITALNAKRMEFKQATEAKNSSKKGSLSDLMNTI